MFNENDDINFVSAMLKKQLGLTVIQQDIKLFDKSNFFEQLSFKAEVATDCKYPCKTAHSLLEIFRHTDYVP